MQKAFCKARVHIRYFSLSFSVRLSILPSMLIPLQCSLIVRMKKDDRKKNPVANQPERISSVISLIRRNNPTTKNKERQRLTILDHEMRKIAHFLYQIFRSHQNLRRRMTPRFGVAAVSSSPSSSRVVSHSRFTVAVISSTSRLMS